MQKGGVDIPVADLVEFLNALPDYVTTSSCSGRIAISSENPNYQKQGTEWLLASHAAVDYERDVAPVLARLSAHDAVLFKFEPVRCAAVVVAVVAPFTLPPAGPPPPPK